MNRFVPIIIIVAVLGVLAYGLRSRDGSHVMRRPDVDLLVAASFYPLADFAQEIGGEHVQVVNMTPPGVSSHDFEPTPQDIVLLESADLFVYNGAGFEPWVERVLPDIEASDTIVIDSSDGVALLEGEPHEHDDEHEHEDEDVHDHEDEHGHEHGDEHDHDDDHDTHAEESLYDPHVWLDPVRAQQQVENILEGFVAADPENAEAYRSRASAYMDELATLDTAYASGLAACQSRDIVVSHNAFSYVAEQYDLTVIPIAGLSPDAEPSAMRLAEITDYVREHSVTHIFFETLVSPRLADTIAEEVSVETLVLNPLEGLSEEELARGDTYLSVQEQNLENLRTALNCQ